MEMVNQYDVEENQTLPVLVLSEDGVNLAAFWARIFTGFGFDKKFNPIYVMENFLPTFDPSFNYIIMEENEWDYDFSIHAFYDPTLNFIVIRSDVYNQAFEGDIIAQSTITHELCHYFQNLLLDFLNTIQCLEYKTEKCKRNSVQMQNQENQTDSITFLILKPDSLFTGKTDEEILDFYIIQPLVKAIEGLLKLVGKEILSDIKTLPLYQKLIGQREEPCAV